MWSWCGRIWSMRPWLTIGDHGSQTKLLHIHRPVHAIYYFQLITMINTCINMDRNIASERQTVVHNMIKIWGIYRITHDILLAQKRGRTRREIVQQLNGSYLFRVLTHHQFDAQPYDLKPCWLLSIGSLATKFSEFWIKMKISRISFWNFRLSHVDHFVHAFLCQWFREMQWVITLYNHIQGNRNVLSRIYLDYEYEYTSIQA